MGILDTFILSSIVYRLFWKKKQRRGGGHKGKGRVKKKGGGGGGRGKKRRKPRCINQLATVFLKASFDMEILNSILISQTIPREETQSMHARSTQNRL